VDENSKKRKQKRKNVGEIEGDGIDGGEKKGEENKMGNRRQRRRADLSILPDPRSTDLGYGPYVLCVLCVLHSKIPQFSILTPCHLATGSIFT